MRELICLGVLESGMTCYNTLFYVRRIENGIAVVCRQCGAEHEVKNDKVQSEKNGI